MADVITISTGTVGNAGNVAADLQTYFAARLLEVAERNTVLDQFGDKHPVPANSSRTIRFNREEKLTVAASPTQLTEGTPPDSEGLTFNQFEAVLEQYGSLVILTDIAELTAKHNVVERTIYVLGLQAAEIYDQLIYNVLDAATNVYRPNGKASDAALVAGDKLSFVDLVSIDAILQGQGARPYDDGLYVLITSPQPYGALTLDPDFKASVQFRAPERIWKAEVGTLGGFAVVRSNAPGFAATTTTATGSADKVYSSFAIGRFAYQISDWQNLRVYVVAPGGQSDPLHQRRKLGWKLAWVKPDLWASKRILYRRTAMNKNSLPTPREDACYAAGIYEGEGTVGAYLLGYDKKYALRRPQIELRIEMNDKDIIRWIAKTFAGNLCTRKRSAQVSFNEPELIAFLKAIVPHMRGKRRRAQTALVFKLYEAKQQRLGRKDEYRRGLLWKLAERINSFNFKHNGPREPVETVRIPAKADDIVQTAPSSEQSPEMVS